MGIASGITPDVPLPDEDEASGPAARLTLDLVEDKYAYFTGQGFHLTMPRKIWSQEGRPESISILVLA